MAVRPPSIDTNLDPALVTGAGAPTVASTQATVNPDGTLASVSSVSLSATTVVSNTSVVVTGNTTTVDSGDNVVVVTTDRDVFITVNEDNFAQNFINNDVNNVGGGSGEVQYNKDGDFAGDNTFTFNDTTKVLSVDGISTDTLLYANGNPWVFSSVSPGAPNNSIQFNDSGIFNGVPGVTYANGKFNLGNVNSVTLNGGSSGQVLTTDGTGNLSWAAPTASYGNSNVAAYLPTYTGNISGDYANFTHDVSANVVDASFLYGDGSNITNIGYAVNSNSANFAGEAFSVSGSNVSGEVANAAFATSAANADFANSIYVEAVNNNYSYHVVLTTGPGDTTLHNDVDDSFQYNPADGILTVTRVDASYFVGSLAFASGLPAANVTGLGNVATVNLNGNAQTFLTGNGTFANIAIPAVGNIATINLNGNANTVLAGDGNWVAQTGGGGANLGNLEVVGTAIQIASGASEDNINIGNGAAGLKISPDSGLAIANLFTTTSDSQTFFETSDYTSGTYTSGGAGGVITLTGATTIENFFNGLVGSIISVTLNGTDTVPYDGAGYGGGTITINTTTPPAVDPTNVTSIEFNIQETHKLLLDPDEGDFGIYIGNENFDIESGRDVRITAGDDFSVESNDNFQLRSRSNTVGGGITLITDYSNAGFNWLFDNTGNLTLPSGGNIYYANGTIYGGSGGLPLANGNSNINIATADGNITLDANGNTFTFGTDGNLTTPSNLVIGPFAGGGSSILQYDSLLQVVGEGSNAITLMGWAANQSTPGSIAVIGMNTPYANGAANVVVAVGNNATTVHYWNFDTTGNLTIPGAIIGDTPNNDGYLNWIGNSSGDGAGYTTLNLVPDSTLTGSDQYVILDPTAPGHIHIRAGGTQDNSFADLFLGGEQSHFKVPAGSNTSVYINADGNSWTFGNDGVLAVPGNINFGGDPSAAPSLNDFFSVTSAVNFEIVTDSANTAQAFTFSTTGNLDIPGSIVANNIGNVAGLNLDGNSGNVLYGNGVFAAAPGGSSVAEASFSIQNANFNATEGSRYGVNTSGGAVTATLPASPVTGGAIFFADAGGAYASNNLTINPNGQTIMGDSGNMTVSTNGQSFGLFYNGSTWRIYNAG